jgi:hypothetical protein
LRESSAKIPENTANISESSAKIPEQAWLSTRRPGEHLKTQPARTATSRQLLTADR